ncbi:hypothetical protein [Pseudomonas psychrophila]|uniref:hypothetical protein n=1 Tax=Pseudomonas psychrophila TaxID=122355 RepID=UPI00036E5E79|nr:hypothetical protein [Pseudomonas psychrophila]
MNIFSVISFILLSAVGAAAVGGEPIASVIKPLAENGTIELFNRQNNNNCTLDFITKKYRLQQGNECENDVVYSFMLHSVPSAATIIMADSGECGKNENFYFEFKTIKYETSVPLIELNNIPTFEEGAVVAPGLRLVKKIWNGEKIGGKLSCVEIIRSE